MADTERTFDEIVDMILLDYPVRTHSVILNVSWGFFATHEADIVIMDNASKYITELEVKRSWADFKADFRKTTTHIEGKVEYLYYVVPESLGDRVLSFLNGHDWGRDWWRLHFPDTAPVGVITYPEKGGRVKVLKNAPSLAMFKECNRKQHKLFLEEENQLLRLGTLRFWSLRKKIHEKK